jgi:hypothetical protein
LSGQAGVVATATGAEPCDAGAAVVPGVAGDLEDAHPAATIAIQRNTRKMHTIAECFIVCEWEYRVKKANDLIMERRNSRPEKTAILNPPASHVNV